MGSPPRGSFTYLQTTDEDIGSAKLWCIICIGSRGYNK